MSRDVAPIFAAIDAMDAGRFVAYLTPDVRFRFANADPAIGHAQVTEGVNGRGKVLVCRVRYFLCPNMEVLLSQLKNK